MSGKSPYVMVVEGNFIIADAVRASLADCGYRVILIGSARAALTLAQRDAPDLAVVDLSLKDGLPGIEAARDLRALGVSVIVCAAFDGDAAKRWIDMLRPVAVLRKPIAPEQMRDAVAAALSRRVTSPGRRPTMAPA